MGVNQSKGSVDITSTPNKGKVAEDIVKPEINGKSDEKIIDEKTTVRLLWKMSYVEFVIWKYILFEVLLLLNRRANFKNP